MKYIMAVTKENWNKNVNPPQKTSKIQKNLFSHKKKSAYFVPISLFNFRFKFSQIITFQVDSRFLD